MAIHAILSSQPVGEEPVANQLIKDDGIKSETSLTSHPEKKRGKFAHYAVGLCRENFLQAVSKHKVLRRPGRRQGWAARNSPVWCSKIEVIGGHHYLKKSLIT